MTSLGSPLIFLFARRLLGYEPRLASPTNNLFKMASNSEAFSAKVLEACEAGETFIKEFYSTLDRRRNVGSVFMGVYCLYNNYLSAIQLLPLS